MSILNFIKRKIVSKKEVVMPSNFKDENEFYSYFFTQHPKWNKPEPNKAEKERLKVIEQLIDAIKTTEPIDIIDFGCGRGWLTNQLSKHGNVLGIEPVANVVNYAKTLFPNLHFEIGSIEKLIKKQVDFIISSEVIEHISHNEQLLFFKAFYDALKPQGYCIITTPRQEVQQEWLAYRNDKGQPIEQWLSEKDVEQLALQSNFKVLANTIIKERANTPDSPLLDLYQVWLFQKNGN